MGPNMFLHEKALEMHCQDLRQEMKKMRLLARLRRRPGRGRRFAGKLGLLLLKLGAWLKQLEQPARALDERV
jgi:hypothetical protein